MKTWKQSIFGLIAVVLFTVLATAVLASCTTTKGTIIGDASSATFPLPDGEYLDHYIRVILWLSNQIGDPTYKGSDQELESAGTDHHITAAESYSKIPYFEIGNVSKNDEGFYTIYSGLRFKTSKKRLGRYYSFLFGITITLSNNECSINFNDFRSVTSVAKQSFAYGYTSTYKYGFKWTAKEKRDFIKIKQFIFNELQKAVNPQPLLIAEVDNLVEAGYRAFTERQYSVARENYYKAAMAEPYRTDILLSYAASLANTTYPLPALGASYDYLHSNIRAARAVMANYANFGKALFIANLVLETDPDNQIANNIRTFCVSSRNNSQDLLREIKNYIAYGVQDRAEFVAAYNAGSTDRLIASMNALTAQLNSSQNVSGGSTGGSGGGQAQSETSGGSSSGSRSNYDISRARERYRQYETAAKNAYDAVVSNPEQTGQRQRYTENQRNMRRIRQEAADHGERIEQSEWETKRLP